MKITYVISSINSKSNGIGGHFYSLLATVSAVNKLHEVQIIHIGSKEALGLQDSGFEIINIIDSNLNTFKLLKKLYKIMRNDNTSVFHAFDDLAYFYVRVINLFLKIPILLTKCGGRNPKFYYPFCKNFINYSNENLNYFKSRKKFKNSNLYLIPNRILTFQSDHIRSEKLKIKFNLKKYDFVFLRIARIGTGYKTSIIQLINLVRECNENGFDTCGLIIGTIEDLEVLEEVNKFDTSNIYIETNSYYTQNAKELIDIADVVLGTGRGFMEAALKGKIMMAPVKNRKLPVLVNPQNFHDLFKTNFSERGKILNFNFENNFNQFIALLSNKQERSRFRQVTKTLYDNNFNILFKISDLDMIYKNLKFSRSANIIDGFLNYLFLLKVRFQIKIS